MRSINILTNTFEYITDDSINNDFGAEYTPSLINLVGGNSMCTMLSGTMTDIVNTTSTGDENTDINNNRNFILGFSQIGSIFNHTHKQLVNIKNNLQPIVNKISTYEQDTCIGMMNLQYACNEFETNDIKNSIGYASINFDLLGNIISYGQYTQSNNINGTNYDGEHQLTSIDITDKCILNDSIGIRLDTFVSTDPHVYNNGNFWLANLSGPVSNDIINPDDNTVSGLIKNLKSKNTENLYLTSLLNFYFSDDSGKGIAPIGLWSRPQSTSKDNSFDSTFLLSDRYNYHIRMKSNITGSFGDYININNSAHKKFKLIESKYLPNFGYSIFYFDADNFSKADSSVTDTINTANQYALTGKNNLRAFDNDGNEVPELTDRWWISLVSPAAANLYSICPPINTNLDFNMPKITYVTNNHNTIYECIRAPYKFYNLNESVFTANDQVRMYIKSCDLTLTPGVFNNYSSNQIKYF